MVRDVFHSHLDPNVPVWSIVRKYRNVLSHPRIFAILRNPVYCGMIPRGGKIFPGKHSALITQETFDRVQEQSPHSNSDIRPKAQRYPYLLGGLVECTCGHRKTPASVKSGQYNYYRCVDIDMANTRIADLDEELSGLPGRQELLQNQQRLGNDVHKLVKTLLLQTKTFSDALRAAKNCSPDDLRTLIHANIQRVLDHGDGTSRITPRWGKSSTNHKDWYTRRDSNSRPSTPEADALSS